MAGTQHPPPHPSSQLFHPLEIWFVYYYVASILPEREIWFVYYFVASILPEHFSFCL
jgi:hypothetical protein